MRRDNEEDKTITDRLYLKLFIVYLASSGTSTGIQYFSPNTRADSFTRAEFQTEMVRRDAAKEKEFRQIYQDLNEVKSHDAECSKDLRKLEREIFQHPPEEWKNRLKYIEDYLFRRNGSQSKIG